MRESNGSIKDQTLELIKDEANKIEYLILAQKHNVKVPNRPLYEEILDTHIYGFSKTIDFVIRLKLVGETEAKEILLDLEKKLYKHINVS